MTIIIISMLQMRKMRLKEIGWQDFQNDEKETALQEKKILMGENYKKHSFKPLETVLRAFKQMGKHSFKKIF